MKIAVIYARYSCDNQTEQSIEGQLRVCNEYAERNNIKIIDSYIDRAMTGTNDNRPAFQQMLKDSKKKLWDYVIVYKLDRFSRDKYESTIHKHTLKENGIKLLSAMENIPDSPEGIILESLLEGMNQYYSAELSQKVKRGMKETRSKGLYQGGGIPYGYKVVDRKFYIDEEQAEIIKFIFESYAGDLTVPDIISNLTHNNKLKDGKPFKKTTILFILKNEKYIGIYRINDEIITDMYPPIISTTIFNKVQAKFKRNQLGGNGKNFDYLLRHKIKCGYCGDNINGECGTDRRGILHAYYKCNSRKGKKCKKGSITKEALENLVVDVIIKNMKDKENLDYITSILIKYQENTDEDREKIIQLEHKKEDIEKNIKKLNKIILQASDCTSLLDTLRDLEKDKIDIENTLLMINSRKQKMLTEEQIKKYYKKVLSYEPKLLIKLFVDKIILFDDSIEIYLATPLSISPDKSQGFSILKGSTTYEKNTLHKRFERNMNYELKLSI